MKELKTMFPIEPQDAEKHKNGWDAYIPEMMPVIEKYINGWEGSYYHNCVIPDLQKMELFAEWEYEKIQRFAYNTTTYVHLLMDEKREQEFEIQMRRDGFYKLTQEIIDSSIDTAKRFYVVLGTVNFLGGEGKKKSEGKMLLKSWGQQGPHWMHPRAKRKGYMATVGQYIKEV